MKISYRSQPIIKKIEDAELGEMGIAPEDLTSYNQHKNLFDRTWLMTADKYQKDIKVLSNSFAEAVGLSIRKTLDESLIKEAQKEETSGTLIMGASVFCYWIYPSEKGLTQAIFRFVETTQGPLKIEAFIYLNLDKNYKGTAAVWFPHNERKEADDKALLKKNTSMLYAIINFIRYAEVETKELPAGQKIKDIDCKYLNDTKSNVQILNSTWFTNLVKSDGFKVRGHFRLQPKKKNGEWTKELIWINDFEKNGYTAPARKLQYN